MSDNSCRAAQLKVSVADKENSKVKTFLTSITDSLDFQQTHCFYHKDKGLNIYTDDNSRESGDNCKIGGKLSKLIQEGEVVKQLMENSI